MLVDPLSYKESNMISQVQKMPFLKGLSIGCFQTYQNNIFHIKKLHLEKRCIDPAPAENHAETEETKY